METLCSTASMYRLLIATDWYMYTTDIYKIELHGEFERNLQLGTFT
jgi:hypothetical protein